MSDFYKPLTKYPHMLHGGDYNPEQWRETPQLWESIVSEDLRMQKLADCNAFSVGIFSWTMYEKEEEQFDFTWLDEILDRLYVNGSYAILATPSGARPAWLAQKYPEVLRVNARREKQLFGQRHNHCFSSPVYREKTQKINRLLAQRYQNHPALLMWHVSNEYSGECHCPLCQQNFRAWLKNKYQTLDNLNRQYWSSFWNHTYTDWSQLESPSPLGDSCIQALLLDWKRFCTHQTIDFFKNEIQPLKQITPNIPVTANFMEKAGFIGLDYFAFAKEVDIISWDCYPSWTSGPSDIRLASDIAFTHDMYRSMKNGRPFMLLESTPSLVNWHSVNPLKKPKMHLLSSMQAVAHGSDSVLYFQWRKGRGGSEKFHGAVVGHAGHENTRVFKDVAEVGAQLKKLDNVAGARTDAKVAMLYDWSNRWALREMMALKNDQKDYEDVCLSHYQAFWNNSIAVDIINSEFDFSPYKILVAPMLYMVKQDTAEKIEKFVENGGTLITTYWSGIVNENDLCYLGGFPGPLKKLAGLWAEEIDTLPCGVTNLVKTKPTKLNLAKQYNAVDFCELVHLESAEPLAEYASDFYAGMPALTVNQFGKGKVYYICFKGEQNFLNDFYTAVIHENSLKNPLNTKLPHGVSAAARTDGENEYIFVMNFDTADAEIKLKNDYINMITGEEVSGSIILEKTGIRIIKKAVR